MFDYYAKWIPNFFDKIQPLVNTTSFPLDKSALSAFELLKKVLERATLHSIDENQPFDSVKYRLGKDKWYRTRSDVFSLLLCQYQASPKFRMGWVTQVLLECCTL